MNARAEGAAFEGGSLADARGRRRPALRQGSRRQAAGRLARVVTGILAFGLAGAPAVPAAAPELRLSPRPVRDEVRAVVAAQLAAFQRGDFAAARALASAGIRQQFRPEVYELMIQRGYAPLLRHRAAEIGVVSDDGAAFATVVVVVEPAAGPKVRYLYHLFREEGGWRVGGVRPHAPPPKADA